MMGMQPNQEDQQQKEQQQQQQQQQQQEAPPSSASAQPVMAPPPLPAAHVPAGTAPMMISPPNNIGSSIASSSNQQQLNGNGNGNAAGHGLKLPPGFRFHPTDEELVLFYLVPKSESRSFNIPVIADVDLYKHNPWELPVKAIFGEREWYFFSPRDRKYPNGARPNRAAASGYWKATGTDKPIFTIGSGQLMTPKIGVKKALVFYEGRAPKGVKTNWIMHEYRLADNNGVPPIHHRAQRKGSLRLDDWVLCRIYKKTTNAQRVGGIRGPDIPEGDDHHDNGDNNEGAADHNYIQEEAHIGSCGHDRHIRQVSGLGMHVQSQPVHLMPMSGPFATSLQPVFIFPPPNGGQEQPLMPIPEPRKHDPKGKGIAAANPYRSSTAGPSRTNMSPYLMEQDLQHIESPPLLDSFLTGDGSDHTGVSQVPSPTDQVDSSSNPAQVQVRLHHHEHQQLQDCPSSSSIPPTQQPIPTSSIGLGSSMDHTNAGGSSSTILWRSMTGCSSQDPFFQRINAELFLGSGTSAVGAGGSGAGGGSNYGLSSLGTRGRNAFQSLHDVAEEEVQSTFRTVNSTVNNIQQPLYAFNGLNSLCQPVHNHQLQQNMALDTGLNFMNTVTGFEQHARTTATTLGLQSYEAQTASQNRSLLNHSQLQHHTSQGQHIHEGSEFGMQQTDGHSANALLNLVRQPSNSSALPSFSAISSVQGQQQRNASSGQASYYDFSLSRDLQLNSNNGQHQGT